MEQAWKSAFKPLLAKELERIRTIREEQKLKLNLIKSLHDDETNPSDEIKFNRAFCDRNARDYLKQLEESNKISDDVMTRLRRELDSKTRELAKLKEKFLKTERQSRLYQEACEETRRQLSLLEYCDSSPELSPESSIASHRIPSPPPVEVPTVEEILCQSDEMLNINHYANSFTKFAALDDKIDFQRQSQPAFIR